MAENPPYDYDYNANIYGDAKMNSPIQYRKLFLFRIFFLLFQRIGPSS